jgi:hypothetical protein
MNLEYLVALLIYLFGVSIVTTLAVARRHGFQMRSSIGTVKRCLICIAAWFSDFLG